MDKNRPLRVFEAFARIGTQVTALKRLKITDEYYLIHPPYRFIAFDFNLYEDSFFVTSLFLSGSKVGIRGKVGIRK